MTSVLSCVHGIRVLTSFSVAAWPAALATTGALAMANPAAATPQPAAFNQLDCKEQNKCNPCLKLTQLQCRDRNAVLVNSQHSHGECHKMAPQGRGNTHWGSSRFPALSQLAIHALTLGAVGISRGVAEALGVGRSNAFAILLRAKERPGCASRRCASILALIAL